MPRPKKYLTMKEFDSFRENEFGHLVKDVKCISKDVYDIKGQTKWMKPLVIGILLAIVGWALTVALVV